MNEVWAKSAAARRILAHWMDARPAWLWSGDGSRLVWRNPAARLFGARQKKSGLRLAAEPVPIKGQVARLIRLGSPGRSSLSRIQFLAGGRPESTTSTVTPLALEGGETGLLIVAVDPADVSLLESGEVPWDGLTEALLPQGADYLIIDEDGHTIGGSPAGLDRYGELLADVFPTITDDSSELELGDERITLTRFKAGPGGEQLILIEGGKGTATIDDIRAEEGLGELERRDGEDEPPLFVGLEPPAPAKVESTAQETASDIEDAPRHSLTSLFDRLAETEALYDELPPPNEDQPVPPADEPESDTPVPADEAEAGGDAIAVNADATGDTTTEEDPAADTSNEPQPDSPEATDVIAAVIAFEDDLTEEAPTTFRVIGRGLTVREDVTEDVPGDEAPEQSAEADVIERASRYNFDELSRILADRVGSTGAELPAQPVEIEPPPAPPPPQAPEGALVSIAGETFILNRLPIGILVFRDQQVLFANRALTDLAGYDTVDSLRAAGIAALFPSDDAASAGPVTHLMRRDGTPMPVTARLQSITWQGRPALMLSASASEMRVGHEAAVRTFAEALAQAQGEGYFAADRAGVIRDINAAGRAAIGRSDDDITGSPLAALVHNDDLGALREFLERPARFAETTRPVATLKAAGPNTNLVIFAEGQAGIVTGYFGFLRQRQVPQAAPNASGDESDPSMLARISRGVRRPLNTIVGFADLIRSSSFVSAENHRHLEYARDIKTAGQEIAVLVDELDEFARLRAGRYAPRPAELDLAALLESCVVRVRGQAGAARVLVRSAISERLPHVRADRASLGQAVLNLLASAIDQSPPGGSVVLSAQLEDDGSIEVNIRDSSAAGTDLGERFVVFRDGVGKDGEALAPVRSSVGLALTRALVSVNACRLSVDPAGPTGTLFSMTIPADLVAQQQAM